MIALLPSPTPNPSCSIGSVTTGLGTPFCGICSMMAMSAALRATAAGGVLKRTI